MSGHNLICTSHYSERHVGNEMRLAPVGEHLTINSAVESSCKPFVNIQYINKVKINIAHDCDGSLNFIISNCFSLTVGFSVQLDWI